MYFCCAHLAIVSRETSINNIPYSNKIFFYISIFNSMKFYRSLLPYLIVLLMAVASFADEPEKMEDAAVHTSVSRFEPIPWNMFIGGMDGFVVGVDWIFSDFNVLYYSASQINVVPKHTLLWTLRTQVLWIQKIGVYLQPTIQYLFADGLLAMFKISIGPEIGYKRKTGFEYGGSVRIGIFFDMFNLEMGRLVNSERTYINFIFNLPTGLGIWV